MKRVKDILSKSSKAVDDAQLMRYLKERSGHDEHHEIEKQMAEDPFLNDAVEGLQQFKSETKITNSVSLLKTQLNKHLILNKARRNRHKLKEQPWIYITIVVLLLLIVIGFIVIKKYAELKK